MTSAPWIIISPQASVAADCQVGNFTTIEDAVTVATGVVIEGGSRLPSGLVVEDGVRVCDHAVFVSGSGGSSATRLRRGCRVGANATIGEDVTIGEGAVVEPGAVVRQDVPPFAIVEGNPAAVVGFAQTGVANRAGSGTDSGTQTKVVESKVRGVLLYTMPFISDPRGNLTVGEFGPHLPFMPKRYFMTFQVPSAKVRGEHAHRECAQFLMCVHGSCAVMVDDGVNREEYLLDKPTVGVLVPPMTWAVEYKHSADSALMVFASQHYDPGDYIRSYEEFLREVSTRDKASS